MKKVETGLYRDKPLYCGDIHGKFIITDHVVFQTIQILRSSANQESLVFWGGHQSGETTLIYSTVIPTTDQAARSVFVSEKNSGRASKAARKNNVSILAQVHSHPGRISWHSDGDDDLIMFQYEGMLSLVVPSYAQEATSISDFSVHQFQKGQWILGSESSIQASIKVAASLVDCRAEPL